MGRMCLINDCNINEPEPAPCCLDCEERQQCPDRCHRKESIFCVGVIEDDSKGISAAIQISSEGD